MSSLENVVSSETSSSSSSSSPYQDKKKNSERIHYLDNLRALAMMLGLYLHGALAYATPSKSVWIATNKEGSVAIDISIWWIHLFRMSLFFFISGYFAKLVIEKRGSWRFLGGRALRLGLPMVVSFPFLLFAMTAVFIFALSYLPEPQGLMGVIKEAIKNPKSEPPQNEITTMHLWFVYYLIFFSILAALGANFPIWNKLRIGLNIVFGVGVAVALVVGVLMSGVPLPAPESFFPTLWPFLFYGGFYLLGWRLLGNEQWIAGSQRFRTTLLVVSVGIFIPYYYFMPALDITKMENGLPKIDDWQFVVEAILTAILSVSWTWLALLYGERYLSKPSSVLRFVADSSYWIYLLHLPIVLFLQTLLIPLEINLWVKLLLVVAITWIFCTATYLVFVRYTPIGWLLHGKRSFP